MSEAKYTRGPWTVAGYIQDDEPGSYPEIVIQKPSAIGDLNVAVAIHVEDQEVCAGNARLIAAAPELLEALKDLCTFDTPLTQEKWDNARAAFAKAQGEKAC